MKNISINLTLNEVAILNTILKTNADNDATKAIKEKLVNAYMEV